MGRLGVLVNGGVGFGIELCHGRGVGWGCCASFLVRESHVNPSTLHTCACRFSLSGCNCCPADRLDAMSAILIENEFAKWSHLQHAEGPAKWSEAGRLSASELELLRKVIDVGRQEPM